MIKALIIAGMMNTPIKGETEQELFKEYLNASKLNVSDFVSAIQQINEVENKNYDIFDWNTKKFKVTTKILIDILVKEQIIQIT